MEQKLNSFARKSMFRISLLKMKKKLQKVLQTQKYDSWDSFINVFLATCRDEQIGLYFLRSLVEMIGCNFLKDLI